MNVPGKPALSGAARYPAQCTAVLSAIVLGLVVAGSNAASAQTTYPNPGGSVVVTNSRSHTQTITPQTVNQQATTSATRIIGQLAGKPPVYDQTFNAPFNSQQAQAGIAQARAAIASAGGPGTMISDPMMTGQTQTSSTSSSSTDTVTGSSQMTTSVDTFGPATVYGCASGSCGTPDVSEDRGLCTFGGANPSPAFPSGQLPSGCETNIPFLVLAGQLDINIDVNDDSQITRTTTVTTTVLTTTSYVLTGTPAAAADFSLTSTARTVTLRQGQTGVFPLTVTALNGYAQLVTFTCTGSSDNSGCAFVPASVTPSGSGAAVALSISTLGPNTGTVNAQALLRATKGAMLFGSFGGLLLLRRRRKLAVLVASMVLAGCGGGGSGLPVAGVRAPAQAPTSVGSTTVSVVGKGADGTTHTITFTVVVTP